MTTTYRVPCYRCLPILPYPAHNCHLVFTYYLLGILENSSAKLA